MRTTTAAAVTALLVVGALVGCRGDDSSTDDDGDDAPVEDVTGEGVASADLVEAGLPTADDLGTLVVAPEGEPEPTDGHCDAASVLPDEPAPETVGAGDAVTLTGTDSGVRYHVGVRGQVAVYADDAAATDAIGAITTEAWDACVTAANEDNEVGDTTVDEDADDGRVDIEASIFTGPGDDTTYRAGVRLARVGRTVVVVEYVVSGQVLDRFDDAEPIDELVDTLADRVAALG